MNKKISIISVLLLGLAMFFGSCSDDDNKNEVSEEWIAYQKAKVAEVIALKNEEGEKIYTPLESDLKAGVYVYYRPSEFIKNNLEGKFDKNEPNPFAIPEVEAAGEQIKVIEKIEYDSDIAIVRYHGWYYDLKGNKIVFDSKEYPNGTGEAIDFTVGGLTDGFKTALYGMKVDDEWIICVPYDMGYGIYGNGSIPGYTTLFFDLMLVEIKR